MCGIAGFAGEGDEAVLRSMCETIAHRGPDGRGFHIDGARGVYLGHLRLAVLDIEGGAQPMWNETGSVCVVYNGEVYNHRELREELLRCGHRFASDHSDTEVLVHGYEEWREELPARLNGMFAFAIYDVARGILFLARDRFGEKPVFYTHAPGFFAFGSELRSLLAHPSVGREIDPVALQKFYAHCFFPAPHTPYRAIRKLPGGHWLRLDLRSGALRAQRYWKFDIPAEVRDGSDDAFAEELRALLSRSVKARLESDVPLGILLSGGVDSSAILACAAEAGGSANLKTFCIGFRETSFDESAYARLMAESVGAAHHVNICDLETSRRSIPEVLSRMGEPIGDGSVLPTFLVSAFARKYVTVALSGDGGDELFAGYDPFAALPFSSAYWSFAPRALHPALEFAARLLPTSDRNMSFEFRLQRWLRGLRYPPGFWNPVWMAALAPGEIASLFDSEMKPEDLYSEALETWEQCESHDIVDRSLVYFTTFYLQDNILAKTDRASMQSALELRSPFLDNDVVEFARRLPRRLKIHKGRRKVLLKKAFRQTLPAEILQRPKKGFGIPLARWLRELPIPEDLGSVPAIDPGVMRRRWERHRLRKEDNRHAIWCWMTLRYFLAGNPAPQHATDAASTDGHV